MKKKIAIYEIEYHLGFIKTLVQLLDFDQYSITIFTVKSNIKDIKEYLGKDFYKVKIVSNKDSVFNLIFNFYKRSNEFDLCFHFSIQTYFLLLPFRYLFFPKCKTILIAFRVENYLGNIFHTIKEKFSFVDLIKNILFNFFRFLIIKKSIAVITTGYRDVKILKSKHSDKKIYEIPFAVNAHKFSYKNNKLLTLGVPGAIDKIRRDYFKILELFQSLKKYKKEVKLILIGSYLSNQNYSSKKYDSYFKELMINIKILNQNGFKIKYFKKKLSQKKYNHLIKKSDIMLTYMKKDVYMDHGWTSVYTESIEHNKFLMTNRKNSPKNIAYIENNFDDEKNFKRIILNFKKNKYKNLKLNYKKIIKNFSQDKYRKKMALIIDEVLQK